MGFRRVTIVFLFCGAGDDQFSAVQKDGISGTWNGAFFQAGAIDVRAEGIWLTRNTP